MTSPDEAEAPLSITIFADFSCPFSYVAEGTLRAVGGAAELTTRAFELYPEPEDLPAPRYAAEEWRSIEMLAADMGLALRPAEFRPRTRKAHEAAAFARNLGKEAPFREALYASYWSEGRDIGRIDVLAELASAIDVDPEEMRIALDIDRYTATVLHDLKIAERLGIQSTPTTFVGSGRSAKVVVGAPAPEELRGIIERQIRTRSEHPSDG